MAGEQEPAYYSHFYHQRIISAPNTYFEVGRQSQFEQIDEIFNDDDDDDNDEDDYSDNEGGDNDSERDGNAGGVSFGAK